MPRAGLDREKIARIAAKIADRYGLQAVTLQSIAQEANVKPPSLYSHIQSLETVKRDLALYGLEELTRLLTAAAIGKSELDLLVAVASAQRELAVQRPGLYAATVAANRPNDAELNEHWNGPVAIFRAVVESYGLVGDETVHAMRTVRTSVHGFSMVDSIKGFRFGVDPDTTFERIIASLDLALRNWGSLAENRR